MFGKAKRIGVLAILGICASGCGPGYEQVDGKWSYVWWNTAHGRNVKKLGADAGTFQILGDEDYAKDSRRVFYRGRVIKDADPSTFEILLDTTYANYAKDKTHVYLEGYPVFGADPATFRVIKTPYGRDATTVYCGTVPMNVANAADFEPVRCSTTWSTTPHKKYAVVAYGDLCADLEITPETPAITGSARGRATVNSITMAPSALRGPITHLSA